jgi:hypothetical protein
MTDSSAVRGASDRPRVVAVLPAYTLEGSIAGIVERTLAQADAAPLPEGLGDMVVGRRMADTLRTSTPDVLGDFGLEPIAFEVRVGLGLRLGTIEARKAA